MSEPFIAEIKIVGFNFPPRGWAFCDGQILPISQNQALFSLLGTTFGGDGRSTFGLPEMRGRSPISPGTGPGLPSYSWGQQGGVEQVTLTTTQIPSHDHQADASGVAAADAGTTGLLNDPVGAYPAQATANVYSGGPGDTDLDGTTVSQRGGNSAHNNVQPYLSVYFCIALVGLFPSRN